MKLTQQHKALCVLLGLLLGVVLFVFAVVHGLYSNAVFALLSSAGLVYQGAKHGVFNR